jgi:putative oxidoreductase
MFDQVQLMSLTGLSGQMAVACFTAHASSENVLIPMLNGGKLSALYCFVFLLFAAAGAGTWSVDAMRTRAGRCTL